METLAAPQVRDPRIDACEELLNDKSNPWVGAFSLMLEGKKVDSRKYVRELIKMRDDKNERRAEENARVREIFDTCEKSQRALGPLALSLIEEIPGMKHSILQIGYQQDLASKRQDSLERNLEGVRSDLKGISETMKADVAEVKTTMKTLMHAEMAVVGSSIETLGAEIRAEIRPSVFLTKVLVGAILAFAAMGIVAGVWAVNKLDSEELAALITKQV